MVKPRGEAVVCAGRVGRVVDDSYERTWYREQGWSDVLIGVPVGGTPGV